MDHRVLADSPQDDAVQGGEGHWPRALQFFDRFGGVVVVSDEVDNISVDQIDGAVGRVAEAPSTLDHDFEHWLQVRRRLTDDAQDLTRRRLSIQGLRRLGEQPDVLDSDDRLVSEGLEKLDFVGREETWIPSRNRD